MLTRFFAYTICLLRGMTSSADPFSDSEVFNIFVLMSADMASLSGGVESICLVEFSE